MATSSIDTTLVWVALPNGIFTAPDGSLRLRVSVRLSPRIQAPDGTSLAQCPLFSGSDGTPAWPDKLRGLPFVIAIQGAGQSDSLAVAGPAALDAALWHALLPDSLPVTGHQVEARAGQSVMSYAVKANFDTLVDGIRGGRVGAAAFDPMPALAAEAAAMAAVPPLARLVPATPEGRAALRAQVRRLQSEHRAVTTAHVATATAGASPAALFFDQMSAFYDDLAAGAAQRYANAKAQNFQQAAPVFDFHQALTVAARYPLLMRALGLVFDLEIALAGVPVSGALRVIPDEDSRAADFIYAAAVQAAPWTRYAIDAGAGRFVAASTRASSDLSAGMLLPPTPDDLCAMGVNLDELAHGVRSAALSFHAQAARAAATPNAAAPAPALTLPAPRSDGLALSRVDWGGNMQALLDGQATLEAALAQAADGSAVTLGAEELLQGLRVDIRREGETGWRSLCRRLGHYDFHNGPAARDWADEGTVHFSVFNPYPDGPGASPWAHETLFRWQGWSLAVPRPGSCIGVGGEVAAPGDAGTGNLPLQVGFSAPPGSLPRLRFGVAYDCRLRTVDVGGNGLAPGDTIPESYTVPLGRYLRFDPLLAPALLAPSAPGPGESIERLVIHGDGAGASSETAERWVAPPKATVQMAEWHGLFDTANGLDPGVRDLIAGLDGAWPDAPYGSTPPAALPYLPDPMSHRASLIVSPDTKPVGAFVDFDGAWPQLQGFRLRIAEGQPGDAPAWDGAARVLTIPVPRGRKLDVDLSSVMADEPDAPVPPGFSGPRVDLGVFDWWATARTNPKLTQRLPGLRQQALWGGLRWLTPARRLALVNAVQRPLIRPAFAPLFLNTRNPGDTFASFGGVTAVDGGSTDKIEIVAQWDEAVDDGVNPPGVRGSQAVVWRHDVAEGEMQWPLGQSHDANGNFVDTRHEFHDTRHRRVSYSLVATTRFREYFPAAVTADAANLSLRSDPAVLDIPASARPAAPKVLHVLPTFGWSEATSGSAVTRTRRCGLRVVMDRPWYDSGDGELFGVVVGHKPLPPAPTPSPPPDPGPRPHPGPGPLPSIAAAPRLTRPADAPAYEAPAGVPPGLSNYVTQWGVDPALPAAALASAFVPLPQHFTNATSVIDGLALAEGFPVTSTDPAIQLSVVTFALQFVPPDPLDPQAPADPARHGHDGRWVADIEIDPGSASFPFLRLALVRVQPSAVERLNLSPVVTADMMPLTPGRSLGVIGDPAAPSVVQLTVDGASFHALGLTTRVAVTVQADIGEPGVPLWAGFSEVEIVAAGSAVPVPLPFVRGSRAMRLVVREYESRAADAMDRSDRSGSRMVERVVYADCLLL